MDQRFTFISFGVGVKSRRHSSALRESEDEKIGGKGAPFFAVPGVGFETCGVVGAAAVPGFCVGLRQSLCCLDAGQCLGRRGGGRGRRRRSRKGRRA